MSNAPTELYLTEIDLFRFGNATGPRLDHIRIDRDIPTILLNGIPYVFPGHHGISLITKERAERTPINAWVWIIPAGTILECGLTIIKDSNDHYLLSPSISMPLDDFRGRVARLASRCTRVWKQSFILR